jgi:hypothetical protein
LLFPSGRFECKFLEKAVCSDGNNLFRVLAFALENNRKITKNTVLKEAFHFIQTNSQVSAEHCTESHAIKLRSDIVFGREVTVARAEENHENKKEGQVAARNCTTSL